MPKIFSDLNLNGSTPAQVRPGLGDWGPELVPSTRSKKRARWLVVLVFVLAVAVVAGVYWFLVSQLTTGS
ncbi:hypothetical protein GC722_08165 [Auraticoccus sp. F435]|uniref:Uncharacterized protein n=1 Tax=Auraticoccus cholistanensis TaxID=2656650 RepID=A0A6A9USU4_9ACTN|nr:hypothetical protein [Auraticoccus cholistanensis]MVA75996.1 hypothetical protein [Auraticoccus cholistanensis]